MGWACLGSLTMQYSVADTISRYYIRFHPPLSYLHYGDVTSCADLMRSFGVFDHVSSKGDLSHDREGSLRR